MRYLKQVIVVRKDLNMPRGKLAAMVAHASMTFIVKRLVGVRGPDDAGLTEMQGFFTEEEYRWMSELDPGLEEYGQKSFAKIVLEVNSLEELIQIAQSAGIAGLQCDLVVDSGHSHNKMGDHAAIAIGPAWPEQLDPITSHLKVYR